MENYSKRTKNWLKGECWNLLLAVFWLLVIAYVAMWYAILS